MMKTISAPMNRLPRLGYRWLKLNEYNISEPLQVPLKPYTHAYLPQLDHEVKINRAGSSVSRLKLLSEIPYGASSELVGLVEDHFNAGIELLAPAGVAVSEPVVIPYHLDGENDVLLDLNVVVAERGASVTVVMEYSSDEGSSTIHNGVTKILAEEGAEVHLVKIQRLNNQGAHFDSLYVEASPYSTVRFSQVELGGKFSITNYLSRVADNAATLTKSMYLGDGERVLDLSYHMIHTGFRSTSDLLVKGALKDKSRKVFRGTLDFKRGARLSEGNEEEYALLLDPDVSSSAIPLLLSEEDDIMGGHAASAGKVDANQLFYLMSRGLSQEEATVSLVKAACWPVLAELPRQVRSQIEGELEARLTDQCTT